MDEYEDLQVNFRLLPGVDLRLWTILLTILLLAGVLVAAFAG
jgi:hypothetical protein